MNSSDLEVSNNNYKYSTKESSVPGTFFHNIAIYDIPDKYNFGEGKGETFQIKKYNEYRIDKLSEKEKLEGWVRVLPKFVVREEEIFRNQKKMRVKKRIRNLSKLKINLSQVPSYLWNRLRKKYSKNNEYDEKNNTLNSVSRHSGYYIRDKIYKYDVALSSVDNEIKKLYKIINSSNPDIASAKYLLDKINSEDLDKGWIIMKAEQIVNEV